MNMETLIKSFAIYVILAATGWIANIVQIIVNLPPSIGDITIMLVIKIIGIFVAPLGVILGFVGFF